MKMSRDRRPCWRTAQLHAIAFTFIISVVAIVMCIDTPFPIGLSRGDCQLWPVIQELKSPGCLPKNVSSFACTGGCSSYVQVSGSKIWQMERSCMCCQESGEREATVALLCSKAKKLKVKVKAPLECMCRPCTSVEENAVIPQEMVDFLNEQPINGHFMKSD